MSFRFEARLDDPQALARLAEEAVRGELGRGLRSLALRARVVAAAMLRDALTTSPEYESLVAGRLREEFGLADPQAMVGSVVEACAAAVRAEAGEGSLAVVLMADDFADALAASGAEYLSVGKHGAHQVPWLRWLLFAGTSEVTAASLLVDAPNRRVAFRSASRTGRAIMVTRRFGPSGGAPARYNRAVGRSPGGYSVDAEFAGTQTDNWLTRAVSSMAGELEDFLASEAARLLGG